MQVGTALVADAQAPEAAMQPTDGAFHHPTVSAQPFLGLDAPACDTRRDAMPAQVVPAEAVVLALIGVELGEPPCGAASAPRNGQGSIKQYGEGLAVMDVCPREGHRQGLPPAINQDVMLGAEFAPVGGIGARVFAAHGGRDAACIHRSP